MASRPLPNEKKPRFNSVLTPQFLQSVALVENEPLKIEAYNDKHNRGNPPDFGLMQFNQSNAKTIFKQQFGFPIQGRERGLPNDIYGASHPVPDVLLDPYINARLSFALLEELHNNLMASKDVKGYAALPIQEKQEALLAAYKSGQGGFTKRWNKEGKYWLKDPDHIKRTNALRTHIQKPLNPKFSRFLDTHEARKRAIIRGIHDPRQAEYTLQAQGFDKNSKPLDGQTVDPAPDPLAKPISTKSIDDAAKSLQSPAPSTPSKSSRKTPSPKNRPSPNAPSVASL